MSGDEFRDILKAAGVKQGAAAEKLGVTRQTVVRWLSGFTPIAKPTARLIRFTFKPKKR